MKLMLIEQRTEKELTILVRNEIGKLDNKFKMANYESAGIEWQKISEKDQKEWYLNNIKLFNELGIFDFGYEEKQSKDFALNDLSEGVTYEQAYYAYMNIELQNRLSDLRSGGFYAKDSNKGALSLFNREHWYDHYEIYAFNDDELDFLKEKGKIRECNGTGEYCWYGEGREINGNFYSDDYLENCDRCEHCDDPIPCEEDSYTVLTRSGEEVWCQDCVDNRAIWSDCDDMYVDNDFLVEVHDSRDYYSSTFECSEAYADDQCHYYSEEGEYWTDDEWDYDNDMPYYYVEDEEEFDEEENDAYDYDNNGVMRVQSYSHTFSGLNFYDEGKVTSYQANPKNVGFELEICRDNDNVNENAFLKALTPVVEERIICKRDGSINNDYGYGIEMVSMPHSFNEFWTQKDRWKTMLNMAKQYGYVSHNRGLCGLHFHISRTAFGSTREEQKENIAKLMYFFDYYYKDIVKISRRSECQCSDWACSYYSYNINFEKYEQAFDEYDNGGGSRYMAVNIQNSATVEIRIMRGTLKESTFFASADFVMTVCDNASKIDIENIDDVNLWLKGIKKETFDYIKGKDAFGNLRNEVFE